MLRDRFPGLEKVDLSESSWLTDEGLALVLRMPRLGSIDVRGCNTLTADSAAAVGALASLRTLNVCECDWMTPELIDALRVRRPDLDIAHEDR